MQSYNTSDAFTTAGLKETISQYADVIVDYGEIVFDWRSSMTKYSKLPVIRNLHDFIFTKNPTMDKVIAKVRRTAVLEHLRMHPFMLSVVEMLLKMLSDSKLKNLDQMFKNFIPNNRWLPFLNKE